MISTYMLYESKINGLYYNSCWCQTIFTKGGKEEMIDNYYMFESLVLSQY
jgi:hypothetical protein